jgi:hypothetical protein
MERSGAHPANLSRMPRRTSVRQVVAAKDAIIPG